MLQLKKQQLQAELATIAQQVEAINQRERALQNELQTWVRLFSDATAPLAELNVQCETVELTTRNVAGVELPVFSGIQTTPPPLDLHATPPWFDDAVTMIIRSLACKAERETLYRQKELIAQELNTTSQRVNLFEKVKIPKCKENIRVIKIAI